MRILFQFVCVTLLAFFWTAIAQAHFGIVIPSRPMVMDNKKNIPLEIDIAFSHPFSRLGMPIRKPVEAFVLSRDTNNQPKKFPLSLVESRYMGEAAFKASLTIDKPGVYQIAVIPEPYYEAAEGSYIIHYAKTIIGAFGDEEYWDEPAGLPVEIIPLIRPFGNYAGNSFSGIALKNGKPLPHAAIEVEYLNMPETHKAPNAYFETQALKTDQNGFFSFAVPWAGWWGFAALASGDAKMDHEGTPADVELGGIIWVNFAEPQVIK